MHSYSTDINKLTLLSKIAVFSLLASLLLSSILNYLLQKAVALFPYIEIPTSISLKSLFGVIFLLFYLLFDEIVWKTSVRGLTLSKTPDLRGEWKGHVVTDYNGGTEIDVKVKIEQKWTSIAITLETENSRSKSLAASILTSESRLIYYYFNEPRSTSLETMHKHYGVTTLDIIDSNKLEGQYFTCRDRKTYGEIYLKKCD